MHDKAVPEDLRRFILTSVPSVPFVEAFLLFRQNAGAALSIEIVAKRLYLPAARAASIVDELRAARIVEGAGEAGNRYAPAEELAPMLDLLAVQYRDNLVGVSDLIHSRTSRTAHQFADAF